MPQDYKVYLEDILEAIGKIRKKQINQILAE